MSDLAVRVHVVHSEIKIGDTLCVLPLIVQLAGIFSTDIHVVGDFADPVKPLTRRLPMRFTPGDDSPVVDIRVEVETAYKQGGALNQHMAASICRLAGVPLPPLPVTLDLVSNPVALRPGIVLSPFSGSKNPWYKVWPLDRWLDLTRRLLICHAEPVYVLGAADEDASAFARAGAIPVLGLPLPEVLDMIRGAVLFVSIDNGLSHLAHFGAVRRHLLIYPALLPPGLVVNPRARVLRGRPEDIDAAQVMALADEMTHGCLAGSLP